MESRHFFFVLNQGTQEFEKKYFRVVNNPLCLSNSSDLSIQSSDKNEETANDIGNDELESMEFVPFELPI